MFVSLRGEVVFEINDILIYHKDNMNINEAHKNEINQRKNRLKLLVYNLV